MKQYHSACSPRFPFVVVLLCVLLSLDTTLGSSNHDDLSREDQDRRGRMIEVSSSNGSSSDDSSRKTVTRKATKKTTAPSTPTPTLPMFLERYPEVKDRSAEEQAHLYMVYTLYLDGAKPDDLTKYATVALNLWSCCKDGTGIPNVPSPGCQNPLNDLCHASPSSPYGPDTECYWKGGACCRYWPDNQVGSRAWPFTACVYP